MVLLLCLELSLVDHRDVVREKMELNYATHTTNKKNTVNLRC